MRILVKETALGNKELTVTLYLMTGKPAMSSAAAMFAKSRFK
jgi:hypothetical protein